MKILFLDVEVAPLTVHAWQLYDVTIGISQIMKSGFTICWSAKWVGDKKIYSASRYQTTAKEMLAPMHKLLDEADAIVTYNGKAFDMKILNKDFLLHGFKKPAPSKHIDLLQIMRSTFKFASNKLDYVSQELDLGKKLSTGGHQLWIDCMNGDEKAFRKMVRYNRHDVVLLEKLYLKVRPWIRDHPNIGLHKQRANVCTNCGSARLQARGYSRQIAATYKRFQCIDCGCWSRSAVSEQPRGSQKHIMRRIVS
jgi:DNA polymerase elongation subunit (family B)